MTIAREDLRFTSGGVSCAAWHLPATTDALTTRKGRPCIVMGHGFGGTRDTGLLAFAEPFAAAGIDAFVFDYRGFGDSGGEQRQVISCADQRSDYHAAVGAARNLPGVDPDRVALWGTSYSGGHVIAVAAQSPHVVAAVSMTPAVDGLETLAVIARSEGLEHLARLTKVGIKDLATSRRRRRGRRTQPQPRTIPIVGPPGSTSFITVDGAEAAYTSFAGPTWRNEAAARHALEVARNRPTAYAGKVACPVLVQIGKADRVVPVPATRRMAAKLEKGVVKEYPVDHFDVYDGVWQRRLLADQLDFLVRVLR